MFWYISEFTEQHYNYEDESQESIGSAAGGNRSGAGAKGTSPKPFVASWMKPKTTPASSATSSKTEVEGTEPSDPRSIDNIARFFGGKSGGSQLGAIKPSLSKPGAFPRPTMSIPAPTGAANLRKNDRVRHSKYGEGTILMREGDGEDAKLTVLFSRHGMKKLMEKFANLQKI